MNETYSALEDIWKRHLSGEVVDIEREVLGLLSRQDIKIRQDDGDVKQINLSIPTSTEHAFVIGLRYIKRDGTYTEDHFLCQKDVEPSTTRLEIEPHYKRRLEFRLPEYRGTHKQQVVFTSTAVKDSNITQVNTISYLKGKE